MKKFKKNFINDPSIKTLIVFTLLWFLGIVLLTLSTTNLFTENFFRKKYIMIYFLMIGSTTAIGKLYYNYWKSKTMGA